MHRALFALVVVASACAGWPGAAQADDASVKAAWDSEDAAFAGVFADERDELQEWRQRQYRRPKPLLAVYRRAERLTARLRRRVRAEEPSSETGEDAKTWALRSLTTDHRSWNLFQRAVRVQSRSPNSGRARRAERRARRTWARAGKQAARARSLFRDAARASDRR